MKKNIKAFIKEIVPIIVGILIALYINNWNDERKDRAYINQIFISIDKELTESNEDINEKMAMQQVLVDTLDHYLDDSMISLADVLIKAKGIYMPVIKISAWKAISNTRIELIDYDKLSTLSNIEELKVNLNIQTEKLVDYFYLNSEETEREKKQIMKLSMSTIIGNEKVMQGEIEKIINE